VKPASPSAATEAERFTLLPLVYIAAPYSSPDPVANTNRVIRIVDGLVDGGLLTPVVPHLTLLWHVVSPRPLEFWYAYDLALLARCDAVLRLPGESQGADREVTFAQGQQIPVFTTPESVSLWATSWHRDA
jgi:hypothetical protein